MIYLTSRVKALRTQVKNSIGSKLIVQKSEQEHLLNMFDLVRLTLKKELIKTKTIDIELFKKYILTVIENTGDSMFKEVSRKLSEEQKIVFKETEKIIRKEIE